jgi:hypothetical protein
MSLSTTTSRHRRVIFAVPVASVLARRPVRYMATPARRASPAPARQAFAASREQQHPLMVLARKVYALVAPDPE